MRIAWIGLGVMGVPMACHLMKNGHELHVYTRTKEKAQAVVDAGGHWHDTVAACVAGCDAVFTMVGFPKDVEQVYFGPEGILENAQPSAYLIDMTTTSPALSVRIFEAAQKRGLNALDAPVSGGDLGARNATLSIMAGGRQEDFDACLPLLSCLGKSIVYTGAPGSGQHTKIANQIAIAGAVAGVAEAVAYGRKAGLDVNNMLDCISKGAAGSWQMQNNGPKMAQGDMAPGFYIKHYIKDLDIAAAQSHDRGLSLPVLEEVLNIYRALEEKGLSDLGTQAISKYYE